MADLADAKPPVWRAENTVEYPDPRDLEERTGAHRDGITFLQFIKKVVWSHITHPVLTLPRIFPKSAFCIARIGIMPAEHILFIQSSIRVYFAKNTRILTTRTDNVERANKHKNMFHLIWYLLIGLIAGVISKSVMHVHMTLFWTIVLGVIGSIVGGAITHIFSRPTNERYHPAGLIFSTLGAILVLYICFKMRIHFPPVALP